MDNIAHTINTTFYTNRIILLLMVLGLPIASADTWPQWRGPHRDGTVTNGGTWPSSLDESHLQLIWRKEIGHGYAGPIVSSDKVFTVETLDKKQEIVRAFDRESGEQLWETAWEGSMKVPFFAAKNGSWVRSTPALDGDSLYVAGMRDVLVCLHVDSGAEKWRVDFMEVFDTPLPNFGFVSSPLVTEDGVYVQAGASVVKLDKHKGKVLWRALDDGGGMLGSAFSSPMMSNITGVPQLIVQTRKHLAGLDPGSGNVLWQQEVKAYRGMNILTPVVIDDLIFTSTYRGATFLYGINRRDQEYQVTELWQDKKSQGYMTTPVVINGKIYHHRRDRGFSCLDPIKREVLWTEKDKFGQYWSLVVNGNQILALDQKGELFLIDAKPESFQLLDRRKVADNTWAHLAVVGDQVFVRELQAIAVYQWSSPF